MEKKKGKKTNMAPSPRMIKAAQIMVVKGGTMASALREAGYSEAIANNPQKVTRSEAFAKLLDKIGLTDERVAKQYNTLSNLRVDQEKTFYASVTRVKVGKQTRRKFAHISDATIEKFISKMPSASLVVIQTFQDKKVVHYTTPLYPALKSGLELTAKSKGLMAPEKFDHGFTFHEPTEEEKKLIGDIFNSNK